MNAIVQVRHGTPDNAFEFREMPDPIPESGEVRISVEMSGLNFADVIARKGLYNDAPPLPYVPGYDVVGCIDAAGEGVDELRPGMRVVAMTRFGGYASKVIARTYGVARIPDDLDSAAATALGTQYCTAWFAAMEMVRLRPHDHVIIQSAAGGVGTALVQIAKHYGCTVYGTTGSPAKMDHLKSIGVDFPICLAEGDFAAEYLAHAKGRKADVIFDARGGSSVRKGLKLLASGGRMVCYGASEMCGPPPQLLRCIRTILAFGVVHPVPLLLHSKGIIGVNMLRIADERPDIIQRCMRSVVGLAREGNLKPVVGHVFPVGDIAAGHAMLESRGSIGKIALRWRERTFIGERLHSRLTVSAKTGTLQYV